jgi:hypothetical protein
MLGWYMVFLAGGNGKWEATSPEDMEFMLSRSAAFDAGAALWIWTYTVKKHGLIHEYYRLIRMWNRFRLEADIPDDVRAKMQEEQSNWHLEETEDGWKLTERIIRKFDLEYSDREVKTEGGQLGQNVSLVNDLRHHTAIMNFDSSYPLAADGAFPRISSAENEPILFRIRVGKPGCGYMKNLKLYNEIEFLFEANGGEYLVYEGGITLYRYDENYNLLETIEGTGSPLIMPKGAPYRFGEFKYTTDSNPDASYILTEFRRKQIYHIKPKMEL